MTKEIAHITAMDKLSKVILEGDLGKLSAEEKVMYYNKTCESMGLNPLTRPFEYITLNNKLTLYARKDCTEQLRRIYGISITKLEPSKVEGIYMVTAYAQDKEGKTDVATGAVSIMNLKGDQLANAILKAETKAKRRVTLSIVGLGWLDETELETIPQQSLAQPEAAKETIETRTETITLYDSWKRKELELAISDACKWINNKLDAIHDHDSLQVYERFVLSNRDTLKLITSKISKDEILSMSQKVKTKRDLYSVPFTAAAPFMDYTPGQTSEEIRELKAEKAASVGMDDSKAEDYELQGDYEYADGIKL